MKNLFKLTNWIIAIQPKTQFLESTALREIPHDILCYVIIIFAYLCTATKLNWLTFGS